MIGGKDRTIVRAAYGLFTGRIYQHWLKSKARLSAELPNEFTCGRFAAIGAFVGAWLQELTYAMDVVLGQEVWPCHTDPCWFW